MTYVGDKRSVTCSLHTFVLLQFGIISFYSVWYSGIMVVILNILQTVWNCVVRLHVVMLSCNDFGQDVLIQLPLL